MNKEIMYKNHKIVFHNLLQTGTNMDKCIIEGTAYQRPDHQFDDILKFLKPNSVVYDIGSYIGTYAIPMALEGMDVIAFEGFPDNYERNKINTTPYNNITLLPIAVSNKNETAFTRFNDCTDGLPVPRNITYVRLDDYITEHNLKNPDLIKLDIEGMETVALFGMTNLLENVRPIWQIGYHPDMEEKYEHYPGFVKTEDGGFDFSRFARDLNYRVFDQFGRRCETFTMFSEYICIPEEKIKKRPPRD
jgi:FkbM family methyltransferase